MNNQNIIFDKHDLEYFTKQNFYSLISLLNQYIEIETNTGIIHEHQDRINLLIQCNNSMVGMFLIMTVFVAQEQLYIDTPEFNRYRCEHIKNSMRRKILNEIKQRISIMVNIINGFTNQSIGEDPFTTNELKEYVNKKNNQRKDP